MAFKSCGIVSLSQELGKNKEGISRAQTTVYLLEQDEV